MTFRRLFGRCKQPPGHKEMGKAKRTGCTRSKRETAREKRRTCYRMLLFADLRFCRAVNSNYGMKEGAGQMGKICSVKR